MQSDFKINFCDKTRALMLKMVPFLESFDGSSLFWQLQIECSSGGTHLENPFGSVGKAEAAEERLWQKTAAADCQQNKWEVI